MLLTYKTRDTAHADEETVATWAREAHFGERATYAVGYVGPDRGDTTVPRFAGDSTLHDAALCAMRLQREGRVYLVQRRRARNLYEYLMIRRRPNE
jgi:hypothetical protein